MAAYQFLALDRKGYKQRGVMEADSGRQIRQALRDQGLVPLAVKPVKSFTHRRNRSRFLFSRGLSGLNLALITRQLAILIQAGLPVEEALQGVARQINGYGTRSLLLAVRSEILEGRNLAQALDAFPGAFPVMYRATIMAGEHSGYLAKVMESLAEYTERRHESHRNIQLAMLYPMILLGLSLVIIAGLLAYVVPQIVEVFTESGQQLPLLTTTLIHLSVFLKEQGAYLLVVLLMIAGGLMYLLRKPQIRFHWHRLLVRLPLVARFSRGLNTARFTATLSILTRSGVPLVEALAIAGNVLSNSFLQRGIKEVTRRVGEGEELSFALQEVGHFSPLMLQMIASGEKSGTLDDMLARIAEFHGQEMDRRITALVRIAEPVMLLIMGLLVMLIVLAVLLPILNLNALVV